MATRKTTAKTGDPLADWVAAQAEVDAKLKQEGRQPVRLDR